MPATKAASALLKSFDYSALRGLTQDQHYRQACLHYSEMIQQADAMHLLPCMVHLALAQRTFQSLEKFYEIAIPETAKSNVRRYSAEKNGRLPFLQENDFFLHTWYAVDASFDREHHLMNGKQPLLLSDLMEPLHKRFVAAKDGIEKIRTAETIGKLEEAIRIVAYSAMPFAMIAAPLGAMTDEGPARRAFLELVRESVQRVVLQAVPPVGRPKHGAAPIRGIEGQ